MDAAPSFEQSLRELQQVVTALEDGSLGLEQSLAEFERGIGLLRVCHETLNRASQKIELLTGFDADGNPILQPFDAAATFAPTETVAKKAPARRKSSPRSETSRAAGSEDSGPVREGVSSPPEESSGPSLF